MIYDKKALDFIIKYAGCIDELYYMGNFEGRDNFLIMTNTNRLSPLFVVSMFGVTMKILIVYG
jgi:hypothetical protein